MSQSNTPLRVCVFGSSSSKTPEYITDESFKLGQLIANQKLVCVHGGGSFGVMGALNKGAESNGGTIIGVIHESFLVEAKPDHGMVVTRGNDLNERKQVLFDTSDCFIVMPGGFGTLDELFDFLCAKGLGMKGVTGKPVVLVNLQGYYTGTVQQLARAESDSLLYAPVINSLHVVDTAQEALAWCVAMCADNNNKPAEGPPHTDEQRSPNYANVVTAVTNGSSSSSNNNSSDVGGWQQWFSVGGTGGLTLQFILGAVIGGTVSYALRTILLPKKV